MTKLGLGTVQWGMPYGIANAHGVPTDAEIQVLLQQAHTHGVQWLDTAQAYGDAEARLGQQPLATAFKKVTKLSPWTDGASIPLQVKASLERLRVDHLDGLLVHQCDVLLESPADWAWIQEVKQRGWTRAIGVSLYQPEQLEVLLAQHIVPDLVQIPYHILDRKFERLFPTLQQLNIQVHVRSVFLQGLYAFTWDGLPAKLSDFAQPLQELSVLCKAHHISPLQAAFQFVKSNPAVDVMVLGCETPAQWHELLQFDQLPMTPTTLEALRQWTPQVNPHSLNPSNW